MRDSRNASRPTSIKCNATPWLGVEVYCKSDETHRAAPCPAWFTRTEHTFPSSVTRSSEAHVANPKRFRNQLRSSSRALPALESLVVDADVRRRRELDSNRPIRKQLRSPQLGL